MDARRIIGGALLAAAAAVLLLAPRGCTRAIDRVGLLSSGRTGVEVQVDPTLISQIGQGALTTYFRQETTKRDYVFVVRTDYEARVDVGSVRELAGQPAPLTVRLPGRITTSSADSITGGTAVFSIGGDGSEQRLFARSTYIRWWLVLVLVVLAGPGVGLLWAGRRARRPGA